MNSRERVSAVLHYENVDRMPVVGFGYWEQTLDLWADQGHISREMADAHHRLGPGSTADQAIMDVLGFDFNWNTCAGGYTKLLPAFETEVLEIEKDGAQIIRNAEGLIVRVQNGVVSIPSEIGTSLTDRKAWEKLYLPRLQYCDDRVNDARFKQLAAENDTRTMPICLHLGSLYGDIRNMLGIRELSYLAYDDEDLYIEIIDTVAELCCRVAKRALTYGVKFDFAHFWEDICFKNGPLVNPEVFRKLVGPHYRKITELVNANGLDIVSLDSDGCIDKLLPIWLDNGVNTMFPIEVGTWNASIAPWREQYGKTLRGVGGMDKRVFSRDRAAVDAEIERLKPLVDLGGYIPCPDHLLPIDSEFELVQYYCEQFRKTF